MSRKTARRVALALLGVFLVLTFIAQVSGVDAIGYVGIAALIVMAVIEFAFDTCPHCHAYAGRQGSGGYCSRCGKPLED